MRRFIFLGLALMGFLSLAAFFTSLYQSLRLNIFAQETGNSPAYRFSLYVPDNRNSFFEEIVQGAKQAAAELDSAILVHSIDPAKNEMEFAAFTGVDGVIVCPYLDEALGRQMEKLRENQMPAVLINHNLPNDQPWPFIGINNFDLGRRIGLILSDSHENIHLAVVYSEKAPGIYTERELLEMGISASMGERLFGSIVRFRTNLNPLNAETLLLGIFRSPGIRFGSLSVGDNPAINTIVFTDPEDTIAAAQTLVDLNLVGKIRIIGFGKDPGIIEGLRKGIISATIVIDPRRIGYEAVYSLLDLRKTGYTSASIDTVIEIISSAEVISSSEKQMDL